VEGGLAVSAFLSKNNNITGGSRDAEPENPILAMPTQGIQSQVLTSTTSMSIAWDDGNNMALCPLQDCNGLQGSARSNRRPDQMVAKMGLELASSVIGDPWQVQKAVLNNHSESIPQRYSRSIK
jgi:hypothetical protein